MRYTEREPLPRVPSFVEIQEEHWKTKNKKAAIDKLGELEDIEEELGIDLVTFVKALKQDYIWVKADDLEGKVVRCSSFTLSHGYFYCEYESDVEFGYGFYAIRDYGETWALTKEELEDV